MILAQVSIFPIGTGSTSISKFIAESENVLKKYPDIKSKLTGMGTELESNNLDEILKAIKEMHQAQETKGAKRIYTSINIDDRKDKDSKLEEKIASVESKLK